MARRAEKRLEDLDKYILDDNLKRNPKVVAQKRQTVFSLLGLGMLIVAVGLIIFGIVEARKFTNNGSWPTTQGDITSVFIRTVTQRRGPTRYCVDANFSYNVGGRNYQHTAAAGYCSTNRAEAEAVAPSYIGGTGRIWYDPTNPDRAANQPITAEWMYIIWGVGALTLIMAISCLAFAMQKPPQVRKLKQPATPI